MSFKSWFGTSEDTGGLPSSSWFEYGQWSFTPPYSDFWTSILILKVQRTSMSFKSSFGALEDAGCSWLGFGILILIWIWSLVFDKLMIRILALYPDFEGAKNIHGLLTPHLGLWRMLEVPDLSLASWSGFELVFVWIWFRFSFQVLFLCSPQWCLC